MNVRHRKALELTQVLTWLADNPEFEEYRDQLNRLIYNVRLNGKTSDEEAIGCVAKAIEDNGCKNVEEICEDTRLPKIRVKKIVAAMLSEGSIAEREQNFRRGPKPKMLYLTGKPIKGMNED